MDANSTWMQTELDTSLLRANSCCSFLQLRWFVIRNVHPSFVHKSLNHNHHSIILDCPLAPQTLGYIDLFLGDCRIDLGGIVDCIRLRLHVTRKKFLLLLFRSDVDLSPSYDARGCMWLVDPLFSRQHAYLPPCQYEHLRRDMHPNQCFKDADFRQIPLICGYPTPGCRALGT